MAALVAGSKDGADLHEKTNTIQSTPFLMLVLVIVATAYAAISPRGFAEATAPQTDTMLSKPCKKSEKCRHHWTLTSRLGHILEVYEETLGRRNRAYRILGVEFTTGKRPGTWYPDFGNGLQSVVVQLTEAARNNRNLALFQLGHEVFHLLEPIKPGGRGSVLEEGLASYFAIAYLDRIGIRGGEAYVTEKNYKAAYEMVARLAKLHRDFYSRLKRLRELNRSFSRISTDDIRAAFPHAPAAMARQLAQPFATAITQR